MASLTSAVNDKRPKSRQDLTSTLRWFKGALPSKRIKDKQKIEGAITSLIRAIDKEDTEYDFMTMSDHSSGIGHEVKNLKVLLGQMALDLRNQSTCIDDLELSDETHNELPVSIITQTIAQKKD